jgi:hypothetical protein
MNRRTGHAYHEEVIRKFQRNKGYRRVKQREAVAEGQRGVTEKRKKDSTRSLGDQNQHGGKKTDAGK